MIVKLLSIIVSDIMKSKALLCKNCSCIRNCKYGIADIWFPSLSIAYGLGILQTLNKSTVIFLHKDSLKPSDLDGLDHITYSSAKVSRPLLAKWIINNVSEADK